MLDPGCVRHARLSEALPVQAALLLLDHYFFSSRLIQVPGVEKSKKDVGKPPNRLPKTWQFCWTWPLLGMVICDPLYKCLCKKGLQLGVFKRSRIERNHLETSGGFLALGEKFPCKKWCFPPHRGSGLGVARLYRIAWARHHHSRWENGRNEPFWPQVQHGFSGVSPYLDGS